MPTYGSFETVSELHRSGLAAVWSARRSAGGEAVFAVKVAQPDTLIYGREAAAGAVTAFLEQADVQRRAAAAGGAGSAWAPVHESGVHEDGAYLVTDLFNRSSVERLVTGRFRVDGPGLHRVASAIVQGLVELDRAARRPHGNLKPSNVLVAGEGNVAIARVALTDPASQAKAKSVATAGDLRALGTILYQFVTHQPFRDAGGYPVPEGREWLALGPGGRKWLALANRLLDPAPATGPPTLDEVAAAVAEAGAAKSRRPSPLILGAAAAALLAGGVGVFFVIRASTPAEVDIPVVWDEAAARDWKDFVTAYVEWGSKFVAALDDPVGAELGGGPRRALYTGDPQLAAVIADIDTTKAAGGMDPMGIAGMTRGDIYSLRDDAPAKVRTVKGLARFRAALQLFTRVEALAGGDWPRASNLASLADQWNAQGWTRAGAALKELAAPNREGMDATQALDRVFIASKGAAEVEAKQADVKALAQTLSATDDAVLERFEKWVGAAGGAEGAASGVDAVTELAARLTDAAALGRRLTAFLESGWRSVDHQYLADESPVYDHPDATPSKELFERWLAEAASPRYAVPNPADDPVSTWRGEMRLREVRAQLDQLRDLKEAPKPEVAAAVNDLGKRVDALKAMEWTRRNVEQKVRDAALVQADLDRVWGDLSRTITEVTIGRAESANAARNQLTARNEIVPNSAAINAAWVGWRDALVKTITESNYTQVPAQAHELEQALVKFNEAMPGGLSATDARRPWHGRLAQVALAEREARAAAAMTAAGAAVPADPGALSASLAAESSGYAEWLRGVESAVIEAKVLEDLLEGGYGLVEADATGATVRAKYDALAASGVFKEPRVAGELRPVTDRVAELNRIEQLAAPAELGAVVTAEPAPRREAVIAAWRRLGALPGRAWPVTPEELRQEGEYRRRVSVVSGLIPDQSRRDALTAEMARAAAERWTRAFAAVTTAADVEAVIAQMPAHGVAAESVAEPRLAYNLLVADLKRAVLVPRASAPSDDDVKAISIPFVEKARALGTTVSSADKAAAVITELEPIVSGTEPPAPPFDPSTVGPGTRGWRGEKVGGAIETLRYTLGADGAGQVLEFRRVEPTDGVPEPVYVCTTEMPVGAMLEVLRAARAEADFLALTAPRVEGPAGWMRAGSAPAVAAEWSADQRGRLARYPGITPTPADLDAGQPGPGLPVQQVSPAGAVLLCRLMGCRLPTPAEWRAAAAATPPGDLSQWNLRDSAWKKQLDHVVKVREVDLARDANKEVLDWPDFGAINRMKSPVERAAAVQGSSDGVLWFRPVAGAVGPAYLNLYGNVAELVFPDAAALEAVNPTGDAVKAAANAAADKFAVVGGSALSAPTVPLDQPQPVDRFDVEDLVGFADVGFRPAFSASGTSTRETYAARLARVLTADPYLH